MQLNDYKVTFHERMLDLAWRQWVALGFKGYGSTWKGSPVDPEALIVFTCQVGRWDPRLFDGMVEWVGSNARWINVTRMKRMLKGCGVVPTELFLALVERSDSTLLPKFKATRLATTLPDQATPLFYGKNDQALPAGRSIDPVFEKWGFQRGEYQSRGVCVPFARQGTETLLLRLRAFLGLNARAELLMHLLLDGEHSSRAMARISGYGAPSVAKALAEMSESGWLVSHVQGRRILYALQDREAWWSLLAGGMETPKSVDWFALLSALASLHHHLGGMTRDQATARQQASRLRRLLEQKAFEGLNHLVPGLRIDVQRLPAGEDLIPAFQKQVDQLLDRWMLGQNE